MLGAIAETPEDFLHCLTPAQWPVLLTDSCFCFPTDGDTMFFTSPYPRVPEGGGEVIHLSVSKSTGGGGGGYTGYNFCNSNSVRNCCAQFVRWF